MIELIAAAMLQFAVITSDGSIAVPTTDPAITADAAAGSTDAAAGSEGGAGNWDDGNNN